MDERDDAVAWVRRRFPDYDTNVLDERVVELAESHPNFAQQLRALMEAPCMGPMYPFDVGPPGERARAKPLTLEQLNARLCLIGGYAVPYQGEDPRKIIEKLPAFKHKALPQPIDFTRLWTVRVPHSHMQAARALLAGLYALNG